MNAEEQKRALYKEAVVEFCADVPDERRFLTIEQKMGDYDRAVEVNSPNNPITVILAKNLQNRK